MVEDCLTYSAWTRSNTCFVLWRLPCSIATAGLNPSENEFRENGTPLKPASRRFIHFQEVAQDLTEPDITEAHVRRCRGACPEIILFHDV